MLVGGAGANAARHDPVCGLARLRGSLEHRASRTNVKNGGLLRHRQAFTIGKARQLDPPRC